ncbi:hypothetical protein SSP24_66550 [Streptomyces spinoverrucosus]|uniref:Uncharacterized protein n=1 Tax=Streptomyces spinoverrucosus TaxID=284043 RepID=A0A4Y3VTL3_9ACTN|nr:hypothetical protein [Streptomyces spinoverrucosus]GEC09000.1 hypothetical protein SSP24_66550 [Streptomyces spinoverrucosus]GHB66158.1 hypothetical protein GCM10010397_40320 [Streptomyces spinoverrucosus]
MSTGTQLFLRLLMLAVAVLGLVVCADRVDIHGQAVRLYRKAALCPAGTYWETAGDCVARTVAEVVDRSWRESCTTDSNGLRSCTTYYSVRIRFGEREDEREEWLDVDEDTYRSARPGDRADLRIWHGEVVRMVTRGHTEIYLTSSEFASLGWLVLAWLLAGAALLALFGPWFFPLLGGWLLLTVPYLMVAHQLLGLESTGVVGWSIAVVLTGVGVWLMWRAGDYVY